MGLSEAACSEDERFCVMQTGGQGELPAPIYSKLRAAAPLPPCSRALAQAPSSWYVYCDNPPAVTFMVLPPPAGTSIVMPFWLVYCDRDQCGVVTPGPVCGPPPYSGATLRLCEELNLWFRRRPDHNYIHYRYFCTIRRPQLYSL